MIIALLLVLGLALGSFVNALVWRMHEQSVVEAKKVKNKKERLAKLSILRGRSMCPQCQHELAPKDLVPLLSWLWLRGKCRYCGKPIAWQYPVVEMCTAVLFVLSYTFWPMVLHGLGLLQFCFWLLFIVGFMALAVYDLRWYLLPDRIVFPLIGLAVTQLIVAFVFFGGGWQTLWSSFWGVVITSGVFFVLYQLSDGTWIGGGDVKLAIALGILVGGPMRGLLLLFFASALGTLASLPLVAAGKAGKETLIPFGPFLLLATGIVQLFGAHLTDWLYRITG